MNKLNILYTIDHNYYVIFLVSLVSLLENNKNKDLIKVYLIQENLSLEELKKLKELEKIYTNFELYIYDATEIYEIIKEYNIPQYRNSLVPSLRLFYSFLIDDVDELIYLDADTIVVNSIDIGNIAWNNTILACKDHMSELYKDKLPIKLEHYYNSGVLFINHRMFKENNCLELILKVINTNNENLQFWDQDILNMALHEQIDTLPLNYNLFSTDVYFQNLNNLFYKRRNIIDFYTKKEIKEAIKNPVILHTTDLYGIRTWHENSVHPYNEIYLYYLNKIFNNYQREKLNVDYNKILFRLYSTGEIIKNLILKKKD